MECFRCINFLKAWTLSLINFDFSLYHLSKVVRIEEREKGFSRQAELSCSFKIPYCTGRKTVLIFLKFLLQKSNRCSGTSIPIFPRIQGWKMLDKSGLSGHKIVLKIIFCSLHDFQHKNQGKKQEKNREKTGEKTGKNTTMRI